MSEFASPRAEVEHCLRMLAHGRINFAARLSELLVPEAPEPEVRSVVELPVIDPALLDDKPAEPEQQEEAPVPAKPKAKTKRRS